MENNSTNKTGANTVSPLSEELLKNSDESASEEIVIYDECGDTLWDRVLAQKEKLLTPSAVEKPDFGQKA